MRSNSTPQAGTGKKYVLATYSTDDALPSPCLMGTFFLFICKISSQLPQPTD